MTVDRHQIHLETIAIRSGEVQRRYVDSMSALDRFADVVEQLRLSSDPQLLTVPIALLSLTSAPYVRGAEFQDQLIARFGNPTGPDESLTRYPSSTEQVLTEARDQLKSR